MDNTAIKKKASKIVKKNIKQIWSVLIISIILNVAYNITFNIILKDIDLNLYRLLALLCNLIIVPISYGISKYILALVKNKKHCFKDIFYFYHKNILECLALYIISTSIIVLGTIAYIIPGVIIYLMFAQAENIFIEGETNPIKAIKKSNEIMKGYKWDYLNFLISFLGWVLLGIFTAGIAFIWVLPYIKVCQKLYYIELTKKSK